MHNGKSQFKFGELVKMRKSFLLGDKKPQNIIFCESFLHFGTSDKNLEA